MWINWKPCSLFVGMPLWKKVWQFLKKLNLQLLYNPATPLLGTYKNWPKGIESRDSKKYLYR